MSAEFESLDSVFNDFNDADPPPDLTVRPARTELVVRRFREVLMSEHGLSRRDDVPELEEGAIQGREECLRARNTRGVAFCLANLALLAKIRGNTSAALQAAREAEQFASQIGLSDLAEQMRALRQQMNGT